MATVSELFTCASTLAAQTTGTGYLSPEVRAAQITATATFFAALVQADLAEQIRRVLETTDEPS